jgi:hypothetical protein
MGLLGGSLFLGAFAVSALGLHRIHPNNPALARLQPFVLAILIGYASGVFSLSRNYIVPTYMVLGLTAAYLQIVRPALPIWFRFDERMTWSLAFLGGAGFIGLNVLTRILLALGS